MLVKLEYTFTGLHEAEETFKKIPNWIKDNENTKLSIVQYGNGWQHDTRWKLEVSFHVQQIVDIECGDHIPPEKKFDLLLETHSHDQQ